MIICTIQAWEMVHTVMSYECEEVVLELGSSDCCAARMRSTSWLAASGMFVPGPYTAVTPESKRNW